MSEPPLASPVSRALKNFGVLMGGRAVAGVLSVVSVTLAARLLGAVDFGVLVLVHTTAALIRGLLNFKPSDTVIRYGVTAFDEKDDARLTTLLRFTLGLDLTTSIAAAVVTIVVMGVVAPRMGLPPELIVPAMLYALTLLVSGTGTAKGVLRLADRFDAISVQQTVDPAVRVLGIGLVYLLDGTLVACLVVWASGLLAEYLYLNVRGWIELRRLRLSPGLPDWRGAAANFPGVWQFVRTLYWQSNLDLAQRQGVTLLVGAFLGAAGAGMFRIAREFADVLAKPVVVIRQAVFPDLARLWRAQDPRFTTLYVRLGLVGGAVALAVVILVGAFAERLLAALVGQEYVHGAWLLTWLMLGAAFELIGAALRPAAYAMGAASAALRLQFASVVCHFVLLVVLVFYFGLIGVGAASTAAAMLLVAGMLWLVRTYASRFAGAAAETRR